LGGCCSQGRKRAAGRQVLEDGAKTFHSHCVGILRRKCGRRVRRKGYQQNGVQEGVSNNFGGRCRRITSEGADDGQQQPTVGFYRGTFRVFSTGLICRVSAVTPSSGVKEPGPFPCGHPGCMCWPRPRALTAGTWPPPSAVALAEYHFATASNPIKGCLR